METKIKFLHEYDADTMVCIKSAYEDLQLMIKEIFTNLLTMPFQLSFGEFILLFEKYDWQDIISKVEDFDFLIDRFKYTSVFDCLQELLVDDTQVNSLKELKSNTYIRYRNNKTDPS